LSDALLRYRNRPSYAYQSESRLGAKFHYTNNGLGFRGPEIARQKPAGVRRVVVVGGSTVYGALDDDPDTLSVQLQAILRQRLGPDIEVINAGVPGYEALREAVFTRSDLLDLNPDVLVSLDGLNDVFFGTLQEWPAQVAADEQRIIADGRFPEIVDMVDRTMFPRGLIEHQLTMLMRDTRQRLHPVAAPRVVNERVIALYAESLGLMSEYGQQRGIAVIAGLQPLLAAGHKRLAPAEEEAVNHEGFWSVGGWQEIAGAMYARLAERARPAVEGYGGVFVDLTGVFDAELKATYAEDAAHYNGLGNRRLAEALAPILETSLTQSLARQSLPPGG
jgi:lysophospholipase L1-like esterase